MMTHIPSPETIIHLLHRLDEVPADYLESEVLDFKRWEGAKKSLSAAVQMAICFANAEGGLVVFGVRDNVKGRTCHGSTLLTFQPLAGKAGHEKDPIQAKKDSWRLNHSINSFNARNALIQD